MSEFSKTCTTCQKPISLSDKSGRWLPYNPDGTQHFCKTQTGTKEVKEEMISVPKAELIKMLEFVGSVEGLTKRLGAALGVQK